jgi:hypothetical protein
MRHHPRQCVVRLELADAPAQAASPVQSYKRTRVMAENPGTWHDIQKRAILRRESHRSSRKIEERASIFIR